MARFTVRVELKNEEHRIPHEDPSYQDLHKKMEENGFSQIILGKNGKLYHLPPAEYNRIGNYTREQVRTQVVEIVKEITEDIGYSYSILVTGPDGRAWIGLEEVD